MSNNNTPRTNRASRQSGDSAFHKPTPNQSNSSTSILNGAQQNPVRISPIQVLSIAPESNKQVPRFLTDFFISQGDEVAAYNAYVDYFCKVFQNVQFIDYLDLHRKPGCRIAGSSGPCKASASCIPIAPKTLSTLGQRFAEILFNHKSNNRPAENRRLMCGSCWCPLALYDVTKPPCDQHPQTFTVWWDNPNVCPIPANIGKILCRCCLELRRSCESEQDFGACIMSYFKRNGIVPRNNETNRPNVMPYHFQSVDDVKSLRIAKERVGTKRQFCLTWLQQRGLVCYPVPIDFNGSPDLHWKSEFEQDHLALYKKALGKTSVEVKDSKMADSNNDGEIMIEDEPEKNAFLSAKLYSNEINNNASMSIDQQGSITSSSSSSQLQNGQPNQLQNGQLNPSDSVQFSSLEALQAAIRNNYMGKRRLNGGDEEKLVKRLKEEEVRLKTAIAKIHKIEQKRDSYISFWLPLDPRPDSKSLNSWNVTRRSLNQPLSKDNYLIVTQFCYHLERMFGLHQFLQWAMQVFPWKKGNDGFEEYQLDRFQPFNYEEFFHSELKSNPDYQEQINNEIQMVANNLQIQEAINQFKQLSVQYDQLYKQYKEAQAFTSGIKKRMDAVDTEMQGLKQTKMIQVINAIEQSVQHSAEVFKSNNLQVVTKAKKTSVKSFSELNFSHQQSYLCDLLCESGAVQLSDVRLMSIVEHIIEKLNDKKALELKFPQTIQKVTQIDLLTNDRVESKSRKSIPERRQELALRNNWGNWNQKPTDVPMNL